MERGECVGARVGERVEVGQNKSSGLAESADPESVAIEVATVVTGASSIMTAEAATANRRMCRTALPLYESPPDESPLQTSLMASITAEAIPGYNESISRNLKESDVFPVFECWCQDARARGTQQVVAW